MGRRKRSLKYNEHTHVYIQWSQVNTCVLNLLWLRSIYHGRDHLMGQHAGLYLTWMEQNLHDYHREHVHLLCFVLTKWLLWKRVCRSFTLRVINVSIYEKINQKQLDWKTNKERKVIVTEVKTISLSMFWICFIVLSFFLFIYMNV